MNKCVVKAFEERAAGRRARRPQGEAGCRAGGKREKDAGPQAQQRYVSPPGRSHAKLIGRLNKRLFMTGPL
ncbi:MAG TPA: hypothetical protein VIX82_03720 [Solirubrobacteraceae bacterium]